MNDISYLYNSSPSVYDAFANDRDFTRQCSEVMKLCNGSPTNLLELMAGPARHSNSFSQLGVKNVIAIDSSDAMRKYATENLKYTNIEYLLGNLPDILGEFQSKSFDCITLLRFGIGYLSRIHLKETISQCIRLLSNEGFFILEAHRFDYISKNLDCLDIKKRIGKDIISGDMIEVIWPDGKTAIDRYGNYIKMDIGITREGTEKTSYSTTENIYSTNDIEAIANEYGGVLEVINNKEMVSFGNDSNLIKIKRNKADA